MTCEFIVRRAVPFALLTCLCLDAAATVVLTGDAWINQLSNGQSILAVAAGDGYQGSALVSANGAHTFTAVTIADGELGNSVGAVTVSAASLIATNSLGIGARGRGALVINQGGSVLAQAGPSPYCATGCDFTVIGNGGGAHGTLTVDGTGASFVMQDSVDSDAGFIVGNGAVTPTFGQPNVPTYGYFNVVNGATADTSFTSIGSASGSSIATRAVGTVKVDGNGSAWNVHRTANTAATVWVGTGGEGRVDITRGGKVSAEILSLAGATTSDGTLNVIGTGSTLALNNLETRAGGIAFFGVGQSGNARANISDGAQVLLDGRGGSAWVLVGGSRNSFGTLNVVNGSTVRITGSDNQFTLRNGSVLVSGQSLIDVAYGAGISGITVTGSEIAGHTALLRLTDQSTLNAGGLLGVAYDGQADTVGDAIVLLNDGSIVNTETVHIGSRGLFGGHGTINGSVFNHGGIFQVGASPDTLVLRGNYLQQGGELRFEIDHDSNDHFLTSTLVLEAGRTLSLTGAPIVFSVTAGTDVEAFLASEAFNLNTFFRIESGARFGDIYDLGQVFGESDFQLTGFTVTGFDAASGQLVAIPVPEPSLWTMLTAGILLLAAWRRRTAASKGP